MDLSDVLGQMGALQSMARDLGITESEAASGAEALLPAILGGFKKQAQSPSPSRSSGVEALGGLLGQLGGGDLLDDVLAPRPTNVSRGNEVLGQIFGSKDVSRTVAKNAATRSGLDPAILKKMLPILSMLVAGYLAKQQKPASSPSGGGLGDLLGGLLGGGGSRSAGAGASGGVGGLASMLDLDGDGNPLDDILRMAGKSVG